MHITPGAMAPIDPALVDIIAVLESQRESSDCSDFTDPQPCRQPMNILGVTAMPREQSPVWVQIVAVPIGAAIIAGFGWCLYYEMRSPPTHTTHICIFAGGVLLGLLVAFGRWFLFPVLVQTVYIIGPLIPGGRRKYDPPAGAKITGEHTGEHKP